MNGYRQEWLGSTTTNRHCVATATLVTEFGCELLQRVHTLVISLIVNTCNSESGLNHARGGTLDLFMTDIPDLFQVTVASRLGNSDHSTVLIAIRVLLKLFVNGVLAERYF